VGWNYDALISELEDKYGLAETQTYQARGAATAALNHWYASEDHDAISHLIAAVEKNNQAIEYVLSQGFYGWSGDTHALLNALNRDKACPFITEAPPSEVTMDNILSAMITAAFDELQTFVGLVDAYRVALWNEPFNAEYYAALARGFMP